MSTRLCILSASILLFAIGCTTSPTQTSDPNPLGPMSTVTLKDTQSWDKKREERREMAKLLLDQAEERSKTQQPNMWRPMDSSGKNESGLPVLEPVQILRELSEPWMILQNAIAPGSSPASATPTRSLLHKELLKQH
ncbi:MAG: hypothetical protein ABIH23_23640 [bacterium]